MERTIAKILSVAFHPLLMPTYGLFIVFQLNTYLTYQYSAEARRFFYLLVFTFTFLAPVLVATYLVRSKQISSLEMANRKERWLPFVFTIVFYLFTYFLLRRVNAAPVFDEMILGATVSIVLSLLITFFWKISIHLVGIGGLIGIVYVMVQFLAPDAHWIIAALILIAGTIGFARIKLEAHSLPQVAAGFFVGFMSTYLPLWQDLAF